ncbi:type IV pilus secretin PilQ [Arenimonas sp. GDDSR-1]|uniref:type IV pilus secretin PilQ n=1 Tax=Arenimonas sp. GDDSR-1 TaxID=2950125 RepID=UPI00262F3AB2|nr:type IV pilus secretin PilQ [Arenimonas sp. GDDSR-1]
MTNIFNSKSRAAGFKSGVLSAALCLLFAQTAWADNVLKDVKAATQADGRTAITLQFAEPVGDIQAFSTDNPPRIAIDLPETSNAFAQRKLLLSTGAAKSVNTVESGGRTRVVVDLAKNTPYRTQALGNTLVLTLDPKSAAGNAVAVSAIDFKRGDNGSGRMIVRFDGANAAPVMKEQGTELVVDIANAKLPADLRRQMDVAGYATPVMNIDARDMGGKTRLVLNTKGKADMMAYQTGNEYVVEVTPKAAAAVAKTDMARTGAVSSGKKTTGYAGRPVTFNFQDVPVRTVLQLIADESNLNIVAADSVGGNVTLRLVNVPWDQALEIVLRAKGLDKRKDGNVIWIGPQQELASYEQAKEDARIAIETREETITEYIQINYGNAEAIAKLLTENSKSGTGGGGAGAGGQQRGFLSSRGSVSFDPRTNTLLLIDIPKKVAEIKQLLQTLDRAVDQVMIEARIVVAQDSFARELGAKFGVNDRYGVDATNPGVTRDSGFNVNLPLSNPAGILNFSILGANTSLDVELQALETKGKGEVISNPRVITSNQKAAVIRQGDEVGYVTTQASGTTTVPQATVEFKEVLLELKVTPTITQDGRVFLDLGVKKDEIKDFLSTPTGDVPQIQKREVSTAVLVDDGQTVVIGGVYEFKNRDDVSKVPFLGDIPFLGSLFKKSSKDMEKAELLIFVTPRILKPAPRVN